MVDSIIIKNGYVYDPINNIDGETLDISIKDGKIVDKASADAEVIDASNMIVMPGAIDIHAHVSSQSINFGRMFTKSPSHSLQTTSQIGQEYVKQGYTLFIEAAVAAHLARHTHLEFQDIPFIDKAFLVLVGSDSHVMDFLKKDKIEECAAYLSWLLKSIKGYGLKLANPGGSEMWAWGKDTDSLQKQILGYDLNPLDIVTGLVKVNELLNLPHSVHIHPNQAGRPGNITTTIQTLESIQDIEKSSQVSRNQLIHLAHAQLHSYGGEDWENFESRSQTIVDYLNTNEQIELDIGQITFHASTAVFPDGAYAHYLAKMADTQWISQNIELQGSFGSVNLRFAPEQYIDGIKWTIGLEIALKTINPWQVQLSTDHPNMGLLIDYPKVISWLASKPARDEILVMLHTDVQNDAILPYIEREYTLFEIAIITRASQAKSLGIDKQRGHLGIGALADLAVYDFDPEANDPSKEYKLLEKAFSHAEYVIKSGNPIVKKKLINPNLFTGSTLWVESKVNEDLVKKTLENLETKLERYSSINTTNLYVDSSYIKNSEKLMIQSDI
ncbi:MAG: formylmethanofuran dehydrogenase subunit A [Candidatus Sifarchaeia archaeon]|jgi:formylmethanofuran dehydrogenase subunit A